LPGLLGYGNKFRRRNRAQSGPAEANQGLKAGERARHAVNGLIAQLEAILVERILQVALDLLTPLEAFADFR
jgi:hypothetical protein